MTKQQIKNREDRIRRANKKFDAMTPVQKRIAIARDVIAQLNSKRLIAKNNTWLNDFSSFGSSLFLKTGQDKNIELRDILLDKTYCTGCALGGMFMCAVERADKLKIGQLVNFSSGDEVLKIHGTDIYKYMTKFFSPKQIALIENAFESGDGIFNNKLSPPQRTSSTEFGKLFDNPSDCMRAIMENIIVNNGVFDSKKLPIFNKFITPGFVK